MIATYLVTDTVWTPKGARGFREEEYGEPETIKTRWIPKLQQVTNEAGTMVGSDTAVQTQSPVKVGDLLQDETGRNWPVVAVAIYPLLSGAEHYREAFL